MPQGKPRGVAVMLHGLTDSPYSLKDIARIYQQQGFIAVVPRLPGHGTAPRVNGGRLGSVAYRDTSGGA